ncbi:MAG: zinc-dependent alcohol dehydrogenase family protein [Proteobacteria bacterium]|nr:zinc-dependent alcohol dehydrogenase family protein [Pseudomonadota bacterium]
MPKIVRFHETGGPEVLKLEELPLDEPGTGEIRLKVEAIGLNNAEMLFRRGHYVTEPDYPARLGIEAAGVVDAVGPGVSGIAVGDRVGTVPYLPSDQHGNWTAAPAKWGVYGESAIYPARAVTPTPANLLVEESAAVWCPYMTAWGGLIDFAQITSDDIVLVTAATSSAGLAGVRIAKEVGCKVIATTRTEAKKQFLFDVAGADDVIVTGEEDLAERVMDITGGQGFTAAYDPVGGPFIAAMIDGARPNARIVNYGNQSPEPLNFMILPMLAKRLTLKTHSLFDTTRDLDAFARGTAYVSQRLESGTLKAMIDRTFPLDEIVESHRYMEAQQQTGKIVVLT